MRKLPIRHRLACAEPHQDFGGLVSQLPHGLGGAAGHVRRAPPLACAHRAGLASSVEKHAQGPAKHAKNPSQSPETHFNLLQRVQGELEAFEGAVFPE